MRDMHCACASQVPLLDGWEKNLENSVSPNCVQEWNLTHTPSPPQVGMATLHNRGPELGRLGDWHVHRAARAHVHIVCFLCSARTHKHVDAHAIYYCATQYSTYPRGALPSHMCRFGVFQVWGRRSKHRHMFSGSRAGAYFRVCAPRAEYASAHRHTPHACAPHAHNLHTHHAHAARVRVCPCARICHCGTPPTRPHASSLRIPPMRARMRMTATHLRALTQGQCYAVKDPWEHLCLAQAASGRVGCAGAVGLGACAFT